MIEFRLQPKQGVAFNSPATEMLYGGAAGGGKSHLLRVCLIAWCLMIPGLQCYLFRRQFPDLWANHMDGPTSFPEMLGPLVGAGRVRINENKKVIVFPRAGSGVTSMIHLCHCQHAKNVLNYQGAEMHVLAIDEAGHFTESMYRYLRGRVRLGSFAVPARWRDLFPRVVLSANPGGVGHVFLKRMFVDADEPLRVRRMLPVDGGMLRQYIPARLEDNPAMTAADPLYEHRLDGLGDKTLIASLRHGIWDVFAGQAFDFRREGWPCHVCEPLPVPPDAELVMSFDWGFGKPFSIGWWWVDSDGRLYRFGEWYGCEAGRSDMGLRMADDDVALGIIEREKELGIWGQRICRQAGHDSFNPKPRYEGGGQGPSTAVTFARHGLVLERAVVKRAVKWREFQSRLRIPLDATTRKPTGELPMLLVYSTCRSFIEIIPSLPVDEKTHEDVDTDAEDHIYDEAALACTYRPLGLSGGEPVRVHGQGSVATIEKGR